MSKQPEEQTEAQKAWEELRARVQANVGPISKETIEDFYDRVKAVREILRKYALPTKHVNQKAYPSTLCWFCGKEFNETGTGYQKDGEWKPVHIGCYHKLLSFDDPEHVAYVPRTVAEAMKCFDMHLDVSAKEEVAKASLNKEGLFLDLGGMGLRNAWNLWGTQQGKSTALFDFFKEIGLPCEGPSAPGDDIGAILSTCYWYHSRGLEYDPRASIPFFTSYWNKQK